MSRLLGLVLAICLAAGGPAAGETPRILTWDDLVPKDAQYPDDPLERLTDLQREDVSFILRARSVQARAELAEDSGLAIEVADREKNLRRSGIDVDQLIARVHEVDAAWRAADEKVEGSLDGQLVRMPGYVLPLEFSGSTITEFLLVPFVGACIHVPPPPPNQIVYVKVKDGYKDAGLFTPVYVTGRMSATAAGSKSIFLTDGNVNVSFGYGLEATTIEKYKE